MPPANTSFGTAVDLGTLPADVTQTDIHDGGTGLNYTVYYKFTAPAGSEMIGAWGFSTIADAYRTVIRPYDSTFNQILGIGANNVPIQFPVTAGQVYYLEFSKTNNLAPTSLRIRAEVGPLNDIALGNILVNDDTTGFPLCVLSHTTNYSVITFKYPIVAGESGCRLSFGPIALEDRDNLLIAFYDLNFQLIKNDTSLGAFNIVIRSCLGANKIYAGSQSSPSVVKSFNTLGIVQSTHTLSTNLINALAARNDETILYYSVFGVNSALKRWDLVNDVALSDLAVGAANVAINDILYISDSVIISVHENLVTHATEARNYTPAGVLTRTYTLPNNVGSFSKLAYANDLTSFWSWTHDGTGNSRFQNIQISDGTVLTDRLQQEYEGGAMNASETATPLSRYGNSFSCPFMIYPKTALAGLIWIDPSLSHDVYPDQTKRIPDPTARTALLGD